MNETNWLWWTETTKVTGDYVPVRHGAKVVVSAVASHADDQDDPDYNRMLVPSYWLAL